MKFLFSIVLIVLVVAIAGLIYVSSAEINIEQSESVVPVTLDTKP